MSRTLRSALTRKPGALVTLTAVAHLPGPSRPALARAIPVAAPPMARSFFNIPLPASWRRSAKKDEPAPAPAPASADASEASAAAGVSPGALPTAQTEAEKTDSAGLFDEAVQEASAAQTKTWTEHKYKSAFHKMSHRKLNAIGRQVAGLPVDEAVMQLAFGDKRAGRTWIKSTLALARDHAEAKGLRRERLVVAETWVSKGQKIARVDIKGRGRMGIKHHPSARIHFVLREGKTVEEKRAEERSKVLRKVRSAGIVREDGKLRRKMNHGWGW